MHLLNSDRPSLSSIRAVTIYRVPTAFSKSNSSTFQDAFSSFSSTLYTVYSVFPLFHFFVTFNQRLSFYKKTKWCFVTTCDGGVTNYRKDNKDKSKTICILGERQKQIGSLSVFLYLKSKLISYNLRLIIKRMHLQFQAVSSTLFKIKALQNHP